MRYLRQSTTVTIQVGPFLDSTDGITPENALSPTVQVSKAGAAFGARSSATAIAFDAEGFYRVELNTTDTATAGPLMVKSFVSGACPVWHEFTVMAQARYDLAIEGTGVQPVNLTQIDGTATAGNLATLNLKQLNIVNTAGSAIVATSSGSNGHGMVLQGQGTGSGMRATGGATGHGFDLFGGATSGDGINSAAQAGNGHGLRVIGQGAGEGLSAQGGATGHGAECVGGATSGDGIKATSTGGQALGDAAVDAILNRNMTTPTGVPAATATLASALGRVYMALRNKVTVSATDKTFYDDAGTATFKKPIADSAGVYTEDEGTTP